MSDWKTKQYEIKLKVSQTELDKLDDLKDMSCHYGAYDDLKIIKKLNTAFHKEVVRQEKEKDIKNRVK